MAFTTKEFNTKKELTDFIDENSNLFQFVGFVTNLRSNGKYGITY